MPDSKYLYAGNKFETITINPEKYRPQFFSMQLELESQLFAKLRQANGILPYRLIDSSEQVKQEIAVFFKNNANTFYFLFDAGQLIGSVLYLGNYIQSLAIAPAYQRMGYGEQLTKFAVNAILDAGHATVSLSIMDGNFAAERLYRKLGFFLDSEF